MIYLFNLHLCGPGKEGSKSDYRIYLKNVLGGTAIQELFQRQNWGKKIGYFHGLNKSFDFYWKENLLQFSKNHIFLKNYHEIDKIVLKINSGQKAYIWLGLLLQVHIPSEDRVKRIWYL